MEVVVKPAVATVMTIQEVPVREAATTTAANLQLEEAMVARVMEVQEAAREVVMEAREVAMEIQEAATVTRVATVEPVVISEVATQTDMEVALNVEQVSLKITNLIALGMHIEDINKSNLITNVGYVLNFNACICILPLKTAHIYISIYIYIFIYIYCVNCDILIEIVCKYIKFFCYFYRILQSEAMVVSFIIPLKQCWRQVGRHIFRLT